MGCRLRRVRRVAVGALALVVATTGLGSGVGSAEPSQDPEHLAFSDGTWTMLLTYNAILSYEIVFGTATGDGGGTFTVANDVASGNWNFDAETHVSVAGQASSMNVSYTGTVQGPASEPTLVPTEGSTVRLIIYSATCSFVTGSWVQDYEELVTSLGFQNAIDGWFWAYRSAPPDIENFEQKAEALITQAEALADSAKMGNVDAAALDAVVSQAEELQSDIGDAAGCNTLANPGDFNQLLTAIIADLLATVAANPGNFSTGELYELILLGVRVGALGEGAVDQQFSDQTLNTLETALSDRLDLAIAASNAEEIGKIQLVATAVGWTGLAQKADDAS